MIVKIVNSLTFLLVTIVVLQAQDNMPAVSDQLSLDHKIHKINKIKQVITNLGYLGYSCPTSYGGWGNITCEYPLGSGNDYLYSGAPIFAGIRGNKKLFSTADS